MDSFSTQPYTYIMSTPNVQTQNCFVDGVPVINRRRGIPENLIDREAELKRSNQRLTKCVQDQFPFTKKEFPDLQQNYCESGNQIANFLQPQYTRERQSQRADLNKNKDGLIFDYPMENPQVFSQISQNNRIGASTRMEQKIKTEIKNYNQRRRQ